MTNRHRTIGFVENEIRDALNMANPFFALGKKGKGVSGDTHTFTSIKPWCNPARIYVEKVFAPHFIAATYGPVSYDYTLPGGDKSTVPQTQSQDITVKLSQAGWASYLLGALRSQTSIEFGNVYDERQHEQGAARRTIPMPFLYGESGMVQKDNLKTCVTLLPASERKAAEDAVRKSGGRMVQDRGILYGHEGRRSSRPAKTNTTAGGLRDAIVSVFSSGESSNQRRRARQTRRKTRR